VPDQEQKPLRVPILLWRRLIGELRKRGQGRRESGAFLLGTRGKKRDSVKTFIAYDDLDKTALDTGIIVMKPAGMMKLWLECKRLKMQVLADVHSHPTEWTDQSDSDRNHPMISQCGHIALIVPNYAKGSKWRLTGVGVFEYQGDFRWKPLRTAKGVERFGRSLW
jgi:proteasome lid subunit RPN8/RPN11